MDRRARAALVFAGATVGAVVLHKTATREAAKLGLPHLAVGLIVAFIDYGS
jgi:presenilin-like A22 family membrane protease